MADDEFQKSSEIKEILYKVLVVGNFGVGELLQVVVVGGVDRNEC